MLVQGLCTASLQTLEAQMMVGIIIIPKIMLVCYDAVIYNEKFVFGLPPHFWHKAPKILGISSVIRVTKMSFVMLMR